MKRHFVECIQTKERNMLTDGGLLRLTRYHSTDELHIETFSWAGSLYDDSFPIADVALDKPGYLALAKYILDMVGHPAGKQIAIPHRRQNAEEDDTTEETPATTA